MFTEFKMDFLIKMLLLQFRSKFESPSDFERLISLGIYTRFAALTTMIKIEAPNSLIAFLRGSCH